MKKQTNKKADKVLLGIEIQKNYIKILEFQKVLGGKNFLKSRIIHYKETEPKENGKTIQQIPKPTMTIDQRYNFIFEPQENENIETNIPFSLKGLCKFIEQEYPNNIGVYINIPENITYIRESFLPIKEAKKIEKLIKIDIENTIPIEQENTILKNYIQYHSENQKTHIISIIANKKVLIEYIKEFENHNITILSLYFLPDTLYQVSKYSHDDNVCLHIYISYHYSYLIIASNIDRQLYYSRILSTGHNKLINTISQKLDISTEKSEKILFSLEFEKERIRLKDTADKIPKRKVEKIEEILIEFSKKIQKEISNTYRSCSAILPKEQQQQIYFSTDFEKEIVLENILKMCHSEKIMKKFPYANTPASLIGRKFLLLSGASESSAMNFCNSNLKKLISSKRQNKSIPKMVLVACSFVFLISSFVIDFLNLNRELQNTKEATFSLFQESFSKEPERNSISISAQAEEILLQKRNKLNLNRKYQGSKLSEIIINLNYHVENYDIDITNINYNRNKESIVIKGNIDSFTSFNAFKNEIQESGIYDNKEIKESNVGSTPGKNLENRVGFQLSLKLKNDLNYGTQKDT